MKTVESEYIKDFHFSSATDFLKSISYGGELYNLLGKNFIYRGHYSDEYLLLPYALRENVLDQFNLPYESKSTASAIISNLEYAQVLNEFSVLQRFYNLSDINKQWLPHSARMRNSVVSSYDKVSMFFPEKWLPEEFWEIAALAQHYGLPTRLLDWSTNINTALYFAVRDYIKPLTTHQRLALQRDMIVNKGKTTAKNMELWALDTRVTIAKEDILPLKIIRPSYSGNPNLAAQEGVFTLWQIDKPVNRESGSENVSINIELVDRTPLDRLLADQLKEESALVSPCLYHITIPQSEAVEIYSYLERINHTAAKLFPGYGGVSLSIKEGVGFKRKADGNLKSKTNDDSTNDKTQNVVE